MKFAAANTWTSFFLANNALVILVIIISLQMNSAFQPQPCSTCNAQLVIRLPYSNIKSQQLTVPVTLHHHVRRSNTFKYVSIRMGTMDGESINEIPIQNAVMTLQARTSPLARLLTNLRILWDFSRPHTLVGSAISIVCLYAYAIPSAMWFSEKCLKSLFLSSLPSFLMNIYITGLNQVSDVEIDKINKPYLPIAADRLSQSDASWIVLTSLVLSTIGGILLDNIPINLTLLGSCILGTIYSLPPFRLKRFPLFAALCILAVRGSIVNLGFFLAAKTQVLGHPLGNSLSAVLAQYPECLALTTFFAIFGVVIALMKDIPDVEGDRLFQISSFSVKIGPRKMFRISWTLLAALLGTTGSAVVASAIHTSSSLLLGRAFAGISLLAMSGDTILRARNVDAENSGVIFDFYMHIWKLFYVCYFLLPFLK